MGTKELKPKVKSPEQALTSLMALCARAERSSGDAIRLMKRWGVEPQSASKVLARLIDERFIDDARYAQLFVREKVNLNGWGKRKISSELYRKGVDRDIIEDALSEVDNQTLIERLRERLERKLPQTKYKDKYELKAKLLRHAAAQGYDYATASQVITELISLSESDGDEAPFIDFE